MHIMSKIFYSFISLLLLSTAYSSSLSVPDSCGYKAVQVENLTEKDVAFRLMARSGVDAKKYGVKAHYNVHIREFWLEHGLRSRLPWETSYTIKSKSFVCLHPATKRNDGAGYQSFIFGEESPALTAGKGAYININIDGKKPRFANQDGLYNSRGLQQEIAFDWIDERHIQMKPQTEFFECEHVTLHNTTSRDVVFRLMDRGSERKYNLSEPAFYKVLFINFWRHLADYSEHATIDYREGQNILAGKKVCVNIHNERPLVYSAYAHWILGDDRGSLENKGAVMKTIKRHNNTFVYSADHLSDSKSDKESVQLKYIDSQNIEIIKES